MTFEVPYLDIQPLFERRELLTIRYDADLDTLYIRPGPNALPGISHYINNGIYIRFDPMSKAVVGIQIEDFQQVVMRLYPQVERAWRQVQSHPNQANAFMQFAEEILKIVQSYLSGPFILSEYKQLAMPAIKALSARAMSICAAPKSSPAPTVPKPQSK